MCPAPPTLYLGGGGELALFVIEGGIVGTKPFVVALVGATEEWFDDDDDAFVAVVMAMGDADRRGIGELRPELVFR